MYQRRTTKLVTTRTTVWVVRAGIEGGTLSCDFTYDPGDPFAMSLVFRARGQDPIIWTFGRDLLLQGIDEPAGTGDVHVRPCLSMDDHAGVAIVLSSPDGMLELHARRRDVQTFITAMLDSVASGEECATDLVDDELNDIIG